MNYILTIFLLTSLAIAKPKHTEKAADPKGATKDDVTRMVEEEFNKETTNVKAEWDRVNARITELSLRRDKAIEESKTKGQWEVEGAELMQKFETVITARYHNNTGEFDGGMEVSARDQENMNKVFNRYLMSTPLKGRVSAGEAVRFLQWGNKRLTTLSKTHLEPTESNNSDLEMIAAQIKTGEAEQARLVEMGKLVGLEFAGSANPEKPKKSTRQSAPLLTAPTPVAENIPEANDSDDTESKPLLRAPASSGTKKKAAKGGPGGLLPDF